MHLILKFRINSFNISPLKSNETCFVWYLNCWKHSHLNFRISALLSLHNQFKFLYQFIVISIITMAHLVLFCFILNLTGLCPDYLSVRFFVSCRNLSIDSWWFLYGSWFCRGMFPNRFSLYNFSWIYFFIIDSVLMLQDYGRVPMYLFYLPMMPICFVARKSKYF